MEKEKAGDANETPIIPNEEPTRTENIRASELREPRWSVVSFEQPIASGLTYEEAERVIAEQLNKGISGLCIITDEAAKGISRRKN